MILPEIFLVGPVGFQIRPVGLAILPAFSLHTSPGIRLLQRGDPVLGVSHHQGHGGLLCADSQSSHPRHKPAQHKASVTVPIPAGREVQQAAQGHTASYQGAQLGFEPQESARLSQQLQALASAVVEGTVDGAGDVRAETSTGQTRLGRDSRAKARGQERRAV